MYQLFTTILTKAEVAGLTGYSRPTSQRKWLTAHEIPYGVNAKGETVVSRAAVESFLQKAYQDRPTSPNLEVLNGSEKKPRQTSAGKSVSPVGNLLASRALGQVDKARSRLLDGTA